MSSPPTKKEDSTEEQASSVSMKQHIKLHCVVLIPQDLVDGHGFAYKVKRTFLSKLHQPTDQLRVSEPDQHTNNTPGTSTFNR
jgi:hypothetical protein